MHSTRARSAAFPVAAVGIIALAFVPDFSGAAVAFWLAGFLTLLGGIVYTITTSVVKNP